MMVQMSWISVGSGGDSGNGALRVVPSAWKVLAKW